MSKRRIGRLLMIGALLAVPLVTGCESAAGPAGAPRGVSVSDLDRQQYFYQGEYLGQRVTVRAAVSEVLGPRSFTLSGGGAGEGALLVLTGQPVEVTKGQLLDVTGTVGQLHVSAPSEHVPYIQQDLYAKHETKTYLYDATVRGGGTSP